MKRNYEGDFAKIEAAARDGRRCPQNHELQCGATSELAHSGRIKVFVYAKNYRVVEILTGEHAGARTLDDPCRRPDDKPYRIIDATAPTLRRNIPLQNRQEPWKPGTPRAAANPDALLAALRRTRD